MESYQNHLGINITNAKLQIVEVAYSEGEFILENVGEEFLSEFVDFNNKKTKIISLLQSAFNEIEISKSFNSKYFSFTLPHNLFKIIQLPIENSLMEKDLQEYLKWEFSILYPDINQEELLLQFIKLDGIYPTAIVIGTLRRYIEILKDFCLQNKANLKFVDNVHFASDNLLCYESDLSEKSLVLSLYLSNDLFSIDLLQNNKPVQFQLVPFKQSSEIIPAIEKFIEASKVLNGNKDLINQMFISGDNIPDSLSENLVNILRLEVGYINPFDKIKHNPSLEFNKFISSKPFSFSSVAGIAYRMFS